MERRQIPAGTSLAELATIGIKEQQLASVVLDAFTNELSMQKKCVTSNFLLTFH